MIANNHTPLPDSAGTLKSFTGFNAPSVDAGNVAFAARDQNFSQGIYAYLEGEIVKIIGDGDLIDGKDPDLFQVGRDALSGNRITFQVTFTDFSKAIYVATIPEPGTALLLGIGIAALATSRRAARPAGG